MRSIPHLITLFRLLCSPLIAWLLLARRFQSQPRFHYALALVFLAGISDWMDGYAARRLKSSGQLGVILDPLADKVMLVTLFVVLALVGLIPFWMFWLAVVRDLVIVFGALLVRIFRGIRKFVPSILGKVSTFFQIVLILLTLVYAAFPLRIFLWLKLTALVLAALFTLLSGIGYVRLGIAMARRKVQVVG